MAVGNQARTGSPFKSTDFLYDQGVAGLKFYSKDGAIVLQTGHNWVADGEIKTHTVHLQDGERVINYKSESDRDYPKKAYHRLFQLIIGRLV